LTIPYKGHTIIAKYEFGNHNVGEIFTTIKKANKKYFFKLKKNSHFKLLFSKNKFSLKVIIESNQNQRRIEGILSESGLEQIAKETSFNPEIKFITKGLETEVKTHFYLGFKNKEKSILPVINFYKDLINLLSR